jgi:isopenicillin-N epimerase
LVLGRGNEDRLQPLQVSWGWHPDRTRADEPDEFGTTPRMRFYEFEGTRDYCPWLTVPAAIEFQEGLGFAAVRERNETLVQHVHNLLGENLGLPPRTPRRPELHGFMTAFALPADVSATELRQGLWERHRVEAPVVERPAGLLIRVSTHFYNTEEEIDRLAKGLAALLP